MDTWLHCFVIFEFWELDSNFFTLYICFLFQFEVIYRLSLLMVVVAVVVCVCVFWSPMGSLRVRHD